MEMEMGLRGHWGQLRIGFYFSGLSTEHFRAEIGHYLGDEWCVCGKLQD